MSDTHRYVGSHADMIQVGDKVVSVAPGDFVSLGKDDLSNEINADMIENGTLMALKAQKGGE